MVALPAIEDSGALEDVRTQARPGWPGVPVKGIGWQGGEEASGTSVVRRRTAPARAGPDAGGCQVPAEAGDCREPTLDRNDVSLQASACGSPAPS